MAVILPVSPGVHAPV